MIPNAAQFVEHIQIIIAGQAVGSECDIDVLFLKRLQRKALMSEIRVTAGAVYNTGICALQGADVGIVEVITVYNQGAGTKAIFFPEPGNRIL